MRMDRRQLLNGLGCGFLATVAPFTFSACSTTAPARTATDRFGALLLPMTGRFSGIARSIQQGARLAESAVPGKSPLRYFDTGETAAGAAAAANAALAAGAGAIVGPLFAAHVAPIAEAVAGRIPIVALTNDLSARRAGAFIFGVTASQSVSTIFQYARERGVRRVAVIAGNDNWGRQASDAARRVGSEVGLETLEAGRLSATPEAVLESILTAGGGVFPEAILATQSGAEFGDYARLLQGSGVQLLGTIQALDGSLADLAQAEGCWLSAPDPAASDGFAQSFARAHSVQPGLTGALAFDAVKILNGLQTAGRLTLAGLSASPGFPAVTGAVRFREDGACVRELAIVTVAQGKLAVVDKRAGV